MNVREEGQRNPTPLCVPMASQGLGTDVIRSEGYGRETSAPSVGTRNIPVGPDCSLPQHCTILKGEFRGSCPSLLDTSSQLHQALTDVEPPVPDTEPTSPEVPDPAVHVDIPDHSLACGVRAGRIYCNQLCWPCDPAERRHACQEAASLSGSSGTVPGEKEACPGAGSPLAHVTASPAGRLPGVSGLDSPQGERGSHTSAWRHGTLPCQCSVRRGSLPETSLPGTTGGFTRCLMGDAVANADKGLGRHRCIKDGYSSLERPSRKHKAKSFAHGCCRCPAQGPPALKQTPGPQNSGSNGLSEFVRNKKERSTLLFRRYYKDNKEVKKSVCTGTRAIVKTLPSGHIGERGWQAVCRKPSPARERQPSPASAHRAWLQPRSLQACSHLRSHLRVRHSEVHYALRTEENLLHPSRKLLASVVSGGCGLCFWDAQSCACDRHPSLRASLQRTTVSALITGALLEATAAIGARSGLPSIAVGSTGRAMLKERQLCGAVAASSVMPVSVAGISKELADLQHLVQFPEEIASILTEQEQQLYRRVFPLDYLCFLTRDLGTPECQKRHPHLKASLSAPAMSTHSGHRNSVEDLVTRFNEVRGRTRSS
ncbi:hypothetical protein AGOR_G00200290 [Albula goreensis]|uniref:Uncharacterized protein n=1 Tax=Albula goreensis TaxID=1534307 RepID=A0A8T3CW82_9TELE|nr:hypothetical protein AGOR_G00200290 [Albula goreensis]